MNKALEYVLGRLREPSTWAAISPLLLGLGLTIGDDLWGEIAKAGAALAGIAGILIRERSK